MKMVCLLHTLVNGASLDLDCGRPPTSHLPLICQWSQHLQYKQSVYCDSWSVDAWSAKWHDLITWTRKFLWKWQFGVIFNLGKKGTTGRAGNMSLVEGRKLQSAACLNWNSRRWFLAFVATGQMTPEYNSKAKNKTKPKTQTFLLCSRSFCPALLLMVHKNKDGKGIWHWEFLQRKKPHPISWSPASDSFQGRHEKGGAFCHEKMSARIQFSFHKTEEKGIYQACDVNNKPV